MHIGDAHVHFFSRNFFHLLTGNPESACEKLGWDLPPADPSELAAIWAVELDRHGVSRAALIASLPGDVSSVFAARSAYPDRFLAYAMVNSMAGPPPDPSLDAVCLFPAMHRYSLAVSEVERAIEATNTVFVHCGVLSVGIRRKLGLPSPFDMRYSNPLDIHALALRHPDKRFIVPHFGAGMFREALMLCDLCPNVFLDTSSSNSWMRYEGLDLETVFRRAMAVAGPERLLFGTDSSFFPRGWNASVFQQQKRALDALGVPPAEQDLVFGGNLDRLFPPLAVHSK